MRELGWYITNTNPWKKTSIYNCFQICKLGKAGHNIWIEMIKLIETFMYRTNHAYNTATCCEDGTPELIEMYKEVLHGRNLAS